MRTALASIVARDPVEAKRRRLHTAGTVTSVASDGSSATVLVGYDANGASMYLEDVPVASGVELAVDDYVTVSYSGGHAAAPFIAGGAASDGGGGEPGVGTHALLSAVHSDAAAASVARGDLVVGNSTPKWSRLAKGAANSVLTCDGTDPSWSATPTITSLTTTGDLDVGDQIAQGAGSILANTGYYGRQSVASDVAVTGLRADGFFSAAGVTGTLGIIGLAGYGIFADGAGQSGTWGAGPVGGFFTAQHAKLGVSADITVASAVGVLAEVRMQTVDAYSKVTSGYSYQARAVVYAGANIATYYGLYVIAPTLVTGGTVTTKYGIYVADAAMNNVLAGWLNLGTATAAVAAGELALSGRFIGEYQSQSGAWADPSGTGTNGRIVCVWNTTSAAGRIYAYVGSAWKSVALS